MITTLGQLEPDLRWKDYLAETHSEGYAHVPFHVYVTEREGLQDVGRDLQNFLVGE